eukprot:361896-Chlamydomonas_euryale.AAC.3
MNCTAASCRPTSCAHILRHIQERTAWLHPARTGASLPPCNTNGDGARGMHAAMHACQHIHSGQRQSKCPRLALPRTHLA